uniref:Uncharacterized protein n=1 Tax=viral metagenome TaxID=1070528 RepID=A0A6C0K1Y5_9ZZZZ
MSRVFFGVVSTTPTAIIDDTPRIYNQYETTDIISVLLDKGTEDTYTYYWTLSDDLAIINNRSTAVANFTNTGYIGKTTLDCTIVGNNTGVAITLNSIDIYWNSLNASDFSALWNIQSNITIPYDGTVKDTYVISTTPSDATYIIKKTYALNAGEIAISTIRGVSYYRGTITSPTITIIPTIISLLPNGQTSLLWNNTTQTISYLVSGAVPQDTNYDVSGITGNICNNYTAILRTTSTNYILGTYILNWKIIPIAPSNFVASVSNDFTQITLKWDIVSGCIYNIYNNDNLIGSSNTNEWTISSTPDTSYNVYIVATCVSGTSNRTTIAQITTGHNAYTTTTDYDSGYINLSPCCVTGSKNGDIGLINWIQGTNGIIIKSVYVKNCVCNFSTQLLSGTASRTVKWNLNNTLTNFPFSTSTNASNPYSGPVSISIPASNQNNGTTINYSLRALGNGWSINNLLCPSGIYWFSADWRNVGTITTNYPRINSTITYIQ